MALLPLTFLDYGRGVVGNGSAFLFARLDKKSRRGRERKVERKDGATFYHAIHRRHRLNSNRENMWTRDRQDSCVAHANRSPYLLPEKEPLKEESVSWVPFPENCCSSCLG
jgi:hypothetical protein